MSDENALPLCHYCGINTAGSPEHLPGVASLNDTPVTYKYLKTTPGGLREVVGREDDGFVVYTICQSCNTRTGGDYGTAFSKFAHQFADTGTFSAPGHRRVWVALENIEPLRVLKQMAAMVLAAQAIVPNASLAPLQRFVRQKRHPLEEGAGAFYLYRNVSNYGRIASMGSVGYLRLRAKDTLLFTEVSWPPLGLVYSLRGENELIGRMKNVTEWGQYGFHERASLGFSVPQFRVEVNEAIAFGTPEEHRAWDEHAGRIQILVGDTSGNQPTQICTLIKRERKRRGR